MKLTRVINLQDAIQEDAVKLLVPKRFRSLSPYDSVRLSDHARTFFCIERRTWWALTNAIKRMLLVVAQHESAVLL